MQKARIHVVSFFNLYRGVHGSFFVLGSDSDCSRADVHQNWCLRHFPERKWKPRSLDFLANFHEIGPLGHPQVPWRFWTCFRSGKTMEKLRQDKFSYIIDLSCTNIYSVFWIPIWSSGWLQLGFRFRKAWRSLPFCAQEMIKWSSYGLDVAADRVFGLASILGDSSKRCNRCMGGIRSDGWLLHGRPRGDTVHIYTYIITI